MDSKHTHPSTLLEQDEHLHKRFVDIAESYSGYITVGTKINKKLWHAMWSQVEHEVGIAINRKVLEVQQAYLKSVMGSRAETDPDMTFKEFYLRQYAQEHTYKGQKLSQLRGKNNE